MKPGQVVETKRLLMESRANLGKVRKCLDVSFRECSSCGLKKYDQHEDRKDANRLDSILRTLERMVAEWEVRRAG